MPTAWFALRVCVIPLKLDKRDNQGNSLPLDVAGHVALRAVFCAA
jgi:hypothetical protein